MTDITVDQALRLKGSIARMRTFVLDNSAAQTVFKSQAMILDQSEDTLNARQMVDAVTIATADVFVGIAAHGAVVLTTDTESDNIIQVYEHDSIPGFLMSAYGTFTNADLGKTIYINTASTDTLTVTTGSNLPIGVIDSVEDGYVYVRIVSPVQTA